MLDNGFISSCLFPFSFFLLRLVFLCGCCFLPGHFFAGFLSSPLHCHCITLLPVVSLSSFDMHCHPLFLHLFLHLPSSPASFAYPLPCLFIFFLSSTSFDSSSPSSFWGILLWLDLPDLHCPVLNWSAKDWYWFQTKIRTFLDILGMNNLKTEL